MIIEWKIFQPRKEQEEENWEFGKMIREKIFQPEEKIEEENRKFGKRIKKNLST